MPSSELSAAATATVASVVWKACPGLDFKTQQPRVFKVGSDGTVEDRETALGRKLQSLTSDSSDSLVLHLSVQQKDAVKVSTITTTPDYGV